MKLHKLSIVFKVRSFEFVILFKVVNARSPRLCTCSLSSPWQECPSDASMRSIKAWMRLTRGENPSSETEPSIKIWGVGSRQEIFFGSEYNCLFHKGKCHCMADLFLDSAALLTSRFTCKLKFKQVIQEVSLTMILLLTVSEFTICLGVNGPLSFPVLRYIVLLVCLRFSRLSDPSTFNQG